MLSGRHWKMRKEMKDGDLREHNWLKMVRDKIMNMDWVSVRNDVLPFLESEDDLTAFSLDGFMSLY